VVLAASAAAQDDVIPFDSDRWVRYDGQVVEHEGRTCLMGSAYLPHVDFLNGIIEYDVMVDGSRSYPGITFRAVSQLAYEEFYIRPHASGLDDALQYSPVIGGVSCWQLYNGDGYTAPVEIPRGEWIHIRLEIRDRQARVFVGDPEHPALLIRQLQHDPVAGAVGLKSQRNGSAYFSSFRVQKTDDLPFAPLPLPTPPRGLITEWELSRSFKAAAVPQRTYPDPALQERLDWQVVPTEPGGLLNICRHATRSINGEPDVAYARFFLEAEQDEIRQLSFGYSDVATVFLNGQPVFTGNSAYHGRSQNFAGIISLEDALHLPLHEGRNELLFQVMESFGGWGLIAQDNSDDYLHPGLQRLWQLETECRLPECVLYDPQRDVLYVTNYFRGGNEFISKIDRDGRVVAAEWVTGLNRPTGMALKGDRLWVVDRTNLSEIDLEKGEIVRQHELPDPGFPNDVAFDEQGVAYVSDTRGGKIYRLRGEDCEVWLEGGEVIDPNGLLVDGGRLLFGNSSDGSLKVVDLSTREVRPLAGFGAGANVDGLQPDDRGNYLVSDFSGRLFRVTPQGETTELLNTTASGAFCADFAYVPDRKLIVVPGLYDNRLTAYRFSGL
jgi:sugar lactone lactonase YvrE